MEREPARLIGAASDPAVISPADTATMPVVVAYGAGTDSTAMLVGMARLGWVPDAILFADTGNELPRTYVFIGIMQEWLARAGFPPIAIVKNRSPIAGDASLYDECHRKSVLPSLAYGGHSCSLEWKVAPQDRWCREHFGWQRAKRGDPPAELIDGLMPGRWRHGPRIQKIIGYDAGPGDARRIARAMGLWPPGYRYRYPLAEWAGIASAARQRSAMQVSRCRESPPASCARLPGSTRSTLLPRSTRISSPRPSSSRRAPTPAD